MLSVLFGGSLALIRATQTGYGCLRFYYNTTQHWLLDAQSGAYMQDRRVSGSPLDARRGVYTPFGQRTAYISKVGAPEARTFQILIEHEADGRSPAACPDINGCWRTIPTSPDAQKVADLSPINAGLAWSPDGGRLAYMVLQDDGALWGRIASPTGETLYEQPFGGHYANLVVHGWTADGKYLIFSVIDTPHSLTFFWQPGGRTMSVPLVGVPYQGIYPAPAGNKVALLQPNARWLIIVDPDAPAERGIALSSIPEYRLSWSPTGEALAVQYFDPPYWRLDVIRPDGAIFRDVGGVAANENFMTRDGNRDLFWSGDGRLLAFLRRHDTGLNDLVVFDQRAGVLAVPANGIAAAVALAGQEAFVLAEGERTNMRLTTTRLDGTGRRVLAEGLSHVANMQATPDGKAVFFTHIQNGETSVEFIRVPEGERLLLKTGLNAVQFMKASQNSAYFWFWWKAANGAAGAEGFTYNGEMAFHYLLAAPFSGLPITYQSPDGSRALALWASEDGLTDYLQFVGTGKPEAPLNDGKRLSVMASWSPDAAQAAMLTAEVPALPTNKQSVAIFSADGQLLRKFSDTRYGPLAGWSDCRSGNHNF